MPISCYDRSHAGRLCLRSHIPYAAGCVGGINGLANILGDEVCDIYKLFTKSKLQEAVELHLRLVTPNAMVRN
jgi:dihydrodipicolinate synthase/N-acetylneuraminate lyase